MSNKFKEVISDFGTVFNVISVDMYPDDYSGDIANDIRFVRYSVLFTNAEDYNHQRDTELSGLLIARIFSEKGYAASTAYDDAGTLDTALEGKRLPNGTTLGKSTLEQPIDDPANETLVFMQYQIPFTQFR